MQKKWVIRKDCVRPVNVQDYPMPPTRDIFLSSKGKLQFYRSELYDSEDAAFKELTLRFDAEIKEAERRLAVLRRKRTMASQGKNG